MTDRQRFFVAVPEQDGSSYSYHPMKQWLRDHPEHIPEGCHPTDSNSRTLYRELRKLGWSFQETPEEIRLFMPDDPHIVEDVGEENGDDSIPDSSFGLEYQLRDFLKDNLNTIRVN